ncbi:MAG: ATP-binding protein [Nitrospiraceae bacterium]|nr:ATP-binding protein [Nitrospiraceae bacterium]
MRLRKAFYLAAAALAFLGMLLPFEIRFLKLGEFYPETLLYLLFFNLNLFILLGLVYLVSKGFLELYLGVRRRAIGFKFRAKILVLFVVLSITPMVTVYVVASGLAANYMDKIFNTQFRDPLVSSLAMARDIYHEERQKALKMAESHVWEDGVGPARRARVIGPYHIEYLPRLPADATPAMQSAFRGKRGSEVLSTPRGDLVRAEIPRPGGGVIMASTTLPRRLTAHVADIRRANDSLMRLASWRVPIRTNFYLVLGFIALTIMFTALLAALRLARGITGPVSELAAATREIAAGNLDLRVTPRGSDEMGLLVDSFNRMVAELKEGKESLENAYLESDRRRLCMEGILDNIRSGVISLSPEGHVLTVNPGACSILGILGPDVVGKPYETLLTRVESDELKALIKGINVYTLKFIEQELWVGVGKDEKKKSLLRVFITGLRDAKGRHLGLLAVFDDLTELVRAQRALAWQEVARRIAHEIKNPLTPIKLSTERMMKKWADGHADFPGVFERSTRTIIAEVESLRGLVDEFSRLGRMPDIKKRPADLPGLIEEVRNLYRVYKDFSIALSVPPGLPPVDLDPEQFRRVLVNIIDNAREAMNGSGVVSVKIEADAQRGRLLMKISDTGPGIPPDVREKLFEPYFSTKKHGTGLGLAIVHKIVSDHGGYLRVSENGPSGSTFEIELPFGGGE